MLGSLLVKILKLRLDLIRESGCLIPLQYGVKPRPLVGRLAGGLSTRAQMSRALPVVWWGYRYRRAHKRRTVHRGQM
jgi:hypothetical protein